MSSAKPDTSESAALHRAMPQQIAGLARVLSRAFQQDPFYAWLAPSRNERPWRLERFFEQLLRRYSAELSETYTTEGLLACAIWLPPGEHRLSLPQQLLALPDFAHALSWKAMGRGLKLLNHLDSLHARFAPEPHVYLSVLGVDPEAQGRGLASQLLRFRLQRCDAEGREVYLETANQKNVAFYERHGFVLRHTAENPRFPTLWCMTRSARLAKQPDFQGSAP